MTFKEYMDESDLGDVFCPHCFKQLKVIQRVLTPKRTWKCLSCQNSLKTEDMLNETQAKAKKLRGLIDKKKNN